MGAPVEGVYIYNCAALQATNSKECNGEMTMFRQNMELSCLLLPKKS